jgi:hypothetical protein
VLGLVACGDTFAKLLMTIVVVVMMMMIWWGN